MGQDLSNEEQQGSSLKSLLLIGAVVLVCVLFHTALRLWGYARTYSERLSPILNSQNNVIWQVPLNIETYTASLKQLDSSCAESCLVSIDSYFTKDEQLFTLSDEKNRFQHLSRESIKSSEELLSMDSTQILALGGFLDRYPNAKGLLFVNSNSPGVVKRLFTILDTSENFKRFIVCSDYGNVVRTIREKRPHYKTCASQDEETKAHILSSIHLESIANLPTEYFHFTDLDTSRYSESLIKEIKRRTYFSIVPKANPWAVDARAQIYTNFEEYLRARKLSTRKD